MAITKTIKDYEANVVFDASQLPTPTNREEYLSLAAYMLGDAVQHISNLSMPGVRLSVGFPLGARLTKNNTTTGQCWQGQNTSDGVAQIFISPVLNDTVTVIGELAHELGHVLWPQDKHKKGTAFESYCKALNLQGPLDKTMPGDDFKRYVMNRIVPVLGSYELLHGRIDVIVKPQAQKTYMLKASCKCCGHMLRQTDTHIQDRRNAMLKGYPSCPVCWLKGEILQSDPTKFSRPDVVTASKCRDLCRTPQQGGGGGGGGTPPPPPPQSGDLDITPPPPSQGGGQGQGQGQGEGDGNSQANPTQSEPSNQESGQGQDSSSQDGTSDQEPQTSPTTSDSSNETGDSESTSQEDGSTGANTEAPESGTDGEENNLDGTSTSSDQSSQSSSSDEGDDDDDWDDDDANSGVDADADESDDVPVPATVEAVEAANEIQEGGNQKAGVKGVGTGDDSDTGQVVIQRAKTKSQPWRRAAHAIDKCPLGGGCPFCAKDY